MNQKETDERYMRRCLQLAINGRQNARPNPMVGAVIVAPSPRQGGGETVIIGEGYHVRCGEGHAEVNAFASVRPEDEALLKDATIYVSLEPCTHYGKTPPCCDLIIRKGVKRVVVGCVDPFDKVQGRGIDKIRHAGIEVTVGVLEEECLWLNRRFFTFHQHRRPYIIQKWAQTADGFLDDHGQALAISSPFTQVLVHQLRADEDAIVVGHTTWQREHPRLNVRTWTGNAPARYVLGHDIASIDQLLDECYKSGHQSLIVEGGAKTHQGFLDAGLWDEIRIETAPLTVGSGTKAPVPPTTATVFRRERYDAHEIIWLKREKQRP